MPNVTLNNLQGKKTQTLAQWAADATVYNLGWVLIASDEPESGYYQVPHKVANGVDTWSNLYYELSANQYNAIGAANAPTLANYFATINDIPSPLGFTPEDVANKKTSMGVAETLSNIFYLSSKAVYDWGVATFTTTAAVATQITTALTSYVTTADFRLTDSRYGKITAYKNTDVTHTGNTTETVLDINLSIPAGSMDANSVLWVNTILYSIGTAAAKAYRFYIGPTSGSLVGAIQIGSHSMGATALNMAYQRRIANKNALNVNNCYVATATGAGYENVAQTAARTTTNIDFSVQQYLMITVQLGNAADTGGVDNVQIKIDKP